MGAKRSPSLSFSLIAIAIFSVLSLLSFDTLVRPAYAYSFTDYSNTNDATAIAFLGDIMMVSGWSTTDTLRTYDMDNPAVQLGSVACTDCTEVIAYNGNFYVSGPTQIYQVGITTAGAPVIITNLSTTAKCFFYDESALNSSTGELYCGRTGANDDYYVIDLDTMTLAYDSATLNGGGSPCDDPSQIVYATDYIMVLCTGTTDRYSTYTPKTETLLHTQAISNSNIFCPALDFAPDRFLLAGDASDYIYEYSTAGGFSLEATPWNVSTGMSSCAYDSANDRFIATLSSDDSVRGVDASDGTVIFHLGGVNANHFTTGTDVKFYSSSIAIIANGTSDTFTVFSLAGLGVGGASTDSVGVDSDGDGDIDFTLTDTDGDGIVDWDSSIVPNQLDDVSQTAPDIFQTLGFSEDASSLIVAMLIHLLFIGAVAVVVMKTHVTPPMFVWGFIMILSGGIATAAGFMDLIYFFAELVITVAAFAIIMVKGIGQ